METTRNRMKTFAAGFPRLYILRNVLLLSVFFITSFLYAQNTGGSGTNITRIGEEYRISQFISFPAVPDVLRYEVEIQQLSGIDFIPVDKIETEENGIELFLRVGFYRFRVTAFNKMNLPESRSQWQEFQIRPATQPRPDSYQPFYGLYYELADTYGSIIVYGEELSPQSEFALVRRQRDFDWTGVTLEDQRDVILPDQAEVSDNQARLSFSRESLKRGYYNIFIRNPGGMWTLFGQVRVGFRRGNDFVFSFGYSPMIAAFDYENANLHDVRRLGLFNPLGFNLRLSWLPVKTRAGNFGLEVDFYFLGDMLGHSDHIFFLGYMDYGVFNLLYQRPVKERWQHNIRLGAGMGDPFHKIDYGYSFLDSVTALYLNLGYSAQYFIWKNLFLEAGLDVQFAVSLNKDYSLNHLLLRPGLALGWQMGRWAEYAEVAEGAKREEDFSVPVTDRPRGELMISAGWSPVIPLTKKTMYGNYLNWSGGTGNYEQGDQFLRPFNPLGISFTFAYLPYRWGKNKLGLEFGISMLEHINRDKLEKVSGIFDLLFNNLLFSVLYQRVLAESWQMNIKAGIGMATIDYEGDFSYISPTDTVLSAYSDPAFAMSFGASFQYFFRRNAYIDAGLDFIFVPSSRVTRSVMRPNISVGWQFNRNAETGLRLPGTGLPRFR